MEKDNKKLRDDARREYNDTIRVSHLKDTRFHCFNVQSLVRFVRKRDPRYKKYLESRSSSQPTHVVAQAMSSAVRERAAGAYVEQEWQKVENRSTHADLDWAFAEGEEVEEWECVACRKIFRSEAAWNSHERSKKHMKEVERLRLQMEEEDQLLNLETGIQDLAVEPHTYSEHGSLDSNQDFSSNTPPSPTLVPPPTMDINDEIYPILSKAAASLPDHPIEQLLDHSADHGISDKERSGIQTTANQSKRLMGKRKARRNVDLNNPEDVVDTQELQEQLLPTKEPSKREKRRARQQIKQSEKSKPGSALVCSPMTKYLRNLFICYSRFAMCAE